MSYEFTEHHGPLDDYSALVVKLAAEVIRGRLADHDKSGAPDVRDAVRHIGHELNEKFGLSGMRTASNALFALNSLASVRVDKLWHGVGDWLS